MTVTMMMIMAENDAGYGHDNPVNDIKMLTVVGMTTMKVVAVAVVSTAVGAVVPVTLASVAVAVSVSVKLVLVDTSRSSRRCRRSSGN